MLKNYFSDEIKNEKYVHRYEELKKNLNTSEDLYFFNPNDFKKSYEEIQKLNKYSLADYLDLFDVDRAAGIGDDTLADLMSYKYEMEKICEDILKPHSDKVVFKPELVQEKLIENLQNIFLNENIDKLFISSGSLHALRYSLAFEELIKDEKKYAILKNNVKNMEINIVYGPFALLDHKEKNKFVEFLFENADNFNIFFDAGISDKNKKSRLHFCYYHNNENKENTIIFETAHREYLIRRNIIELGIYDSNLDDNVKNFLQFHKERLKNYDKIIKYEDFTDKNKSENIVDYFSFFKLSRIYLSFLKKFNKRV